MTPNSEWLARVEQARLANPRSMELQYLSGMVCLRHGLWGKAQQMLEQVQQVLDAVPNSIKRESEGENSWDRVKRSPVTRLAAWLAIR